MTAPSGRQFMSFGLSPELLRRLDRQVARTGYTRAALVRRSLEHLVDALEDDDDRFDDEIEADRELAARVVRAS